MANIRISLSRASLQANRLEDVSTKLKKELQRISAAKQSISACWEGNAADVFISKLDEQHLDLSKICLDIDLVASDIHDVVERIRRIEAECERAAQSKL